MRRLYLVPVIHSSPDTSLAVPSLEEMVVATLRKELRQQHEEIIAQFWDTIAGFFDRLNVTGFRVYQDGLVEGGEAGIKTVSQGVKEDSGNYRIIAGLLKRGATLVATEDISLVRQEYTYIERIARASSPRELETASLRYRLAQDRLLTQRDSFIAKRIAETLEEGGSGMLFIGAHHDVHARLPSNIQVSHVKDMTKIREYLRALLNWERRQEAFKTLATYLASPVTLMP